MTAEQERAGKIAWQSDMTLVPIVLRADGTTARVHFPTDLTPAEADKIARVIKAYADAIEAGEHIKETSE